MKTILTLLCLCATSNYVAYAQNPIIKWQKIYGGSSFDGGYKVKQTSDGGYILCGYSWSTDGDSKGHHGSNGWATDGWIVKLNAAGDTMWTKSLGGNSDEYANDAVQADDGGYVIALQAQSGDGDVTLNKGGYDYWVVKLNSTGQIIWEKSYGGTGSDVAVSIVKTNDGNFVVAGFSGSTNGDVIGNKGYSDYWIIKINGANGNLIWNKSYGGSDTDEAAEIRNTIDGGFIVTGYSWSNDSDVTSNKGYNDYWVLKLDSTGNKQWQKSTGGNYYDYGTSVFPATGGGYIVAGISSSTNGDVSGNHGSYDYWAVKLNSTGDSIEWQKSYGGIMSDEANSIIQTSDGGFMLAGHTKSSDGDVALNHGDNDWWLLKISSSGVIQWQQSFGGDSLDYLFSVIQANDGSYVATGLTRSINGDVSVNKGKVDMWVMKLLCSPPIIPSICMVTVDSTSTKNVVLWEKPTTAMIDSFRVYRDVVGTYTHIGSVAYENLSKYTDTTSGVNPQITSYKYKISTVDTCGNESPLSNFHKTMHLTNSTNVNGKANLVWDNYVGFTSSFYYRTLRETTPGNFQVIDSVTNSNFTYTDINSPSTSTNYVIEVVHPGGGCTVTKSAENHNTTRSNKSIFMPPAGSAPVAEFTATATNITAGSSVNFYDLSTNTPTAWQWIFTNGNPSSSTDKNPQNITYNSTGCFDVTLIATNSNGSNSKNKTCYINVLPVGISEPFTDNNKVTVHPNPNNGRFIVQTNNTGIARVRVTNALGQQVTSVPTQGSTEIILPTREHGAGIYFLQVITNENTYNQKVIVCE